MKKSHWLCALAQPFASSAAMAAQGDILARFRVINVNPDVKTTGLLASPLSAGVQDDTIPELDFTYMITNNVGAELILAPRVTASPPTAPPWAAVMAPSAKVSVLPPTLTLQYHFNLEGARFARTLAPV